MKWFTTILCLLFCVTLTAQTGTRFTDNLEFATITVNGSANPALDAGEQLTFSVTVRNIGNTPFENCLLTITTTDPYVTFSDSTEIFDYIAPGNQYALNNCAAGQISPDIPDGHVITFAFLITNNIESALAYRSYRVQACSLAVVDYDIYDNGNYNSLINVGETDTLRFTLHNEDNRELQNLRFTLESNEPGIQVVSAPMLKDSLWGDETFYFDAIVTATSPFVDGTTFDVSVNVSKQNEQGTYTASIGSYIVSIIGVNNCEAFTNGVMPATMYGEGTQVGWFIDSTNAYSGLYSIRSGIITHYDSSTVHLPVSINLNSSISFAYKTSSETNYDWLNFYIDGVLKARWSGANDWTEVSYPILTGNHILTWCYIKDKSVNTGSDCVWIDNICLSNYNNGFPSLAVTPDSIGITLEDGDEALFERTLHLVNESNTYVLFDSELYDELHNPVGWVDIATPNGSVSANQQRDITLNFNMNGFYSGHYKALLWIQIPELDTAIRIPIVLDNRVSVEDRGHSEALPITLYPNPTTGCVRVQLEGTAMERIVVMDAVGRIQQRIPVGGPDCQVDLSGLPRGLYLLQITTEHGSRSVVKVVKE